MSSPGADRNSPLPGVRVADTEVRSPLVSYARAAEPVEACRLAAWAHHDEGAAEEQPASRKTCSCSAGCIARGGPCKGPKAIAKLNSLGPM